MSKPPHARAGRRAPDTGTANFTSLNPEDRRTFKGWAFAVAAFYSIATVALLLLLLGSRSDNLHAAIQPSRMTPAAALGSSR